jgi:hypothetical protein
MASGAQVFVESLSADGALADARGGPLARADGRYDRWTALVRALESRSGRLFSVHGQWLAWRTGLAIAPSPRIAADDLDLMWKVRLSGGRVRLVRGARFYEVKPPPGRERDEQALRRARAFLQCMPTLRAGPSIDVLSRIQLALYKHAPRAAPWCLLALAVVLPLCFALSSPLAGAVAAVAVVGAALAGYRLARLMRTIVRAERAAAQGLSDRWETGR